MKISEPALKQEFCLKFSIEVYPDNILSALTMKVDLMPEESEESLSLCLWHEQGTDRKACAQGRCQRSRSAGFDRVDDA